MGNYASTDDIQAEFKSMDLTAVGAIVSEDKVDEFITQEEAVLDALVASMYVVPITGDISKAIMKKMTTLLVKARIKDLLVVKTGKKEVDQGGDGNDLRDQVFNQDTGLIAKIKNSDLPLIDAVATSSTAGVQSYTRQHNIKQVFRKGVAQW